MTQNAITFAWWNVENLFPPNEHPNWEAWDEVLFEEKLENIARVIRSLGPDDQGPDLLGLCEIVTEKDLKLLVKKHLSDLGYRIVHYDSPGLRGIDVAFIYRDSVFQYDPQFTMSHTVVKRISTRDIFEIQLTARDNEAKLVILGNHWPSRGGGVYESEPFRIMAAEQCSVIVDNLRKQNKDEQILVMGDFNDEPFNRSIREYLLAIRDRKRVISRRTKRPYLYNCMWRFIGSPGSGTYYRSIGETPWYLLDQIMVSPGLLRPDSGLMLAEDSVEIFRPRWMRRGNGAPKPFRIVRGKLIKGFSDHFAVAGQLSVTTNQ